MVKYFAICAPWALACGSRECPEVEFPLRGVALFTAISNTRRPVDLPNLRRVLLCLHFYQPSENGRNLSA
jgi:hypothetical protein